MNIPYNRIHKILRDDRIWHQSGTGSLRGTYSNSMWHTDYKQLDPVFSPSSIFVDTQAP